MGAQPQIQPGVTEDHSPQGTERWTESLGMLYQGVITGIVRLQSGRQHITDAESFKNRTKTALAEIERIAINAGYSSDDIKDTQFAVVAFLDEVVLNGSDPVRAEWERRTLQEELFGQAHAGVVFFDRLARLEGRRNSVQLVNVLEIFLFCLLLGFRGRYSASQTMLLEDICIRLSGRLREFRETARELSPQGIPEPVIPVAQVEARTKIRYFREIMLGALALTALLYLVFYWNLSAFSERVLAALRG
jgi:type VI secretion system protein ImpK